MSEFNVEQAMENEKLKNELSLQHTHYFLNLYKFGDSPFWSMHTNYQVAVNDAEQNKRYGNKALHIGIPIPREMFGS